MYADGLGLYLQVGPTGGKHWVYRYRRGAKTTDMGLGALHTVSLAQARRKALACRQQRLEDLDPLTEKRRKKQPVVADLTFEDCAKRYIATKQSEWKGDASTRQWIQSLRDHALPVLGKLPVQLVDTGHVMQALEPFWARKTETAKRVRGRIENILDWAKARGYRQGENPARWRGHLANLLATPGKIRSVEPHAALAADEVPAFLEALKSRHGVSARAISFIALTALRASEATGLRWDEVDLDDRTMTIPARRMKGAAEFRLPLSPQAIAVVERMRQLRQDDYVFSARGQGPLNKNSMRKLLETVGYEHITIHGLRASFSTWAHECTNFAPEVIEASLAHKVGSAVERAYRRGDFFLKRRRLMEAWGAFCAASPATQPGKIVSIGAGR
jgi:integrase